MKKIYIFASILLVSASCMKNTDIIKDKLVSLSITPTVSIESTKALMDASTITGQTIGIQVAKSDGSALYDNQSIYTNVSMTNGTPWVMGTQVYLSSNPARIYAYCPYSATDFSGIGTASALLLNVPATQTMSGQVDYLYAAQDKTVSGGTDNISNSKPSVTLTMNHALAQIAFVFYKDNFSGTGDLSAISIADATTTSNLKINKSGTNDLKMGLATGAITGGEASSTVSVTSVGKAISRTSDPDATNTPATLKTLVDAWVLVVPATITDPTKITFKFTIDAKDYSVSLPAGAALTWAMGNQYIYKVKLSGTAASIQSVTVTDWTRSYGGGVVIQ